MDRIRVKLEVLVDLDPTPGTFHTEASARDSIEAILLHSIGHYNPSVLIDDRP